jgi:hypothetical protein
MTGRTNAHAFYERCGFAAVSRLASSPYSKRDRARATPVACVCRIDAGESRFMFAQQSGGGTARADRSSLARSVLQPSAAWMLLLSGIATAAIRDACCMRKCWKPCWNDDYAVMAAQRFHALPNSMRT